MIVELSEQAFAQIAAANAGGIELADSFESFLQIRGREVGLENRQRSWRRRRCFGRRRGGRDSFLTGSVKAHGIGSDSGQRGFGKFCWFVRKMLHIDVSTIDGPVSDNRILTWIIGFGSCFSPRPVPVPGPH